MSKLSVFHPEDAKTVPAEDVPTSSFGDLMTAAKKEFDLGTSAYKKSVTHVWSMGKLLTDAKQMHASLKKAKLKAEPIWEVRLNEYGISVSSDNRARRLFKNFPNLNEIIDKPIMEAYTLAGISKNSAAKTTATPPSSVPDQDADIESNGTDNPGDDWNDDEFDPNDLDLEDADDETDHDEEDNDPSEKSSLLECLQNFDDYLKTLVEPNKTDGLLDEEVDPVLDVLEQILNNVLEIKMRLEGRIEQSA